MSTSVQPRTAGLPEEKNPKDVTTRSTSDRPRVRKKPEIPRECRRVTWQKRDTRSSRDPAEMRLPRVERPATRIEDPSQETIAVRTDAMRSIAFLMQTISECAIQPKRRRLRAMRI